MINKNIWLFILLLVPFQYHSQTFDDSTKTELECDSITLKSGETMTCLIQQIHKRKITYFICCDVCAVPRDLKRQLVDTIILSEASRKRFYPETLYASQLDEVINDSTETSVDLDYVTNNPAHNIKILMLKKRNGNQKSTLLKKGSQVKVVTKLNEVIKGKLSFGSNNQIYIGDQQLYLKDIKTLKTSSKDWKIASGIIGSTTTLSTLYLVGWGIPVLFLPASATPFLLMLVKKKYDLENDYEIYYLH